MRLFFESASCARLRQGCGAASPPRTKTGPTKTRVKFVPKSSGPGVERPPMLKPVRLARERGVLLPPRRLL
jgi:hypothetical protein